jgi:hypothetical protein
MRPALILAFGALLWAGASLPIAAHARMKPNSLSNYDGIYSVEITTEDGSCDKIFRGSVTVTNRRIAGTGDAGASASGLIEDDGTVSLTFRGNNQIAHVGGKLLARHGSGTWSSPTAECGGRWRAERQG